MKKFFLLLLTAVILSSCFSSDGDSFEMGMPSNPPVDIPVEECLYCIPEGAIFACQEIIEAMDFLNDTVRGEVGVPPLEWDCQLAQKAQEWAEYLAQKGLLQHEGDSTYGENIYIIGGFIPTLKDAIEAWYAEKEFFQYGLSQWCIGDKECRHYTQLIWRDTTSIGCGIARYPQKYMGMYEYVIVCKFYPPGNIIGEQPY